MHLSDQFESLGANCEFGFVLQKLGDTGSSLLRMAFVLSPQALIAALGTGFAGLYAFENLVPFNPQMVLDTASNIAWHSALRSVQEPGTAGLRFIDPERDRRDIHRFEAAKLAGQVEVIRANLASGERMFVFHKFHGVLTPADITGLFAALRRHGPARLLVVSLATPEQPPGSVLVHAPGLLHGHVDRFAPGARAGDVSLEVWTEICRRALDLAPPPVKHG